MFYNETELYSGGKFGSGETYTWGSCSSAVFPQVPTVLPTKAPTKAPTMSPPQSPTKPLTSSPPIGPTVSPTASPTICDISYEISFVTSSSSSQPAFWTFTYDEDTSIVAKSSNHGYFSTPTYSDNGCLQSNCYTLQIDGISVASSDT